MQWTKLKFSNNEVNRAGDTLISAEPNSSERDTATDILSNWRSAHSFPLHTFAIRLKKMATQVDGDALVVRRLKRTPSILKKLKRDQTSKMKMSRMQDVAGTRAVLSGIKEVEEILKLYRKSRGTKHKLHKFKDYIKEPKKDGYRSAHLVYKYYSDKNSEYDGLSVEIQIRTKLQHFWATAVETVDHFTRQAIKSNEGEKDWMDFFKLISSVFAIAENVPTVPNTPQDKEELYTAVAHLAKKLEVVKKMNEWARIHKIIEDFEKENPKKFDYYLLDLDLRTKALKISGFTKDQEETANSEYSKREERMLNNKEDKDIVLVSAETTKELRKAYPNYFLDTKEFIQALRSFLGSRL
jgi:ppGpp synthetase/RelA/SpoT-type nucleotidyltranferase